MMQNEKNTAIKIIETMPGMDSFRNFEAVPSQIYQEQELEQFQLHQLETEFLKVCLVVLDKEVPKARLGLYINPLIGHDEDLYATLGAYESVDETPYWTLILNKAIQICKENGASKVIGPMSGSTWNDYRFMEGESFDQHMFFGEAYHAAYYPHHFQSVGFKKIAGFHSFLDSNPDFRGIAVQESKMHFESKHIRFRSISTDSYDADLKKIHQFCNEAFSSNFLFSSITQEQFMKKFIPLKNMLDPRFVFLAEQAHGQNHGQDHEQNYEQKHVQDYDQYQNHHHNQCPELIGFALCFHDYYSKDKKRLVIKTLARKNEKQHQGIGKMLGFMAVQKARAVGYEQIVHALMHEDNSSVNLSRNSMGKEFKNYSLFGINLVK